MGLFDAKISQATTALNAKARELGVTLRDGKVTLDGNTPTVTGEVDSEEDRQKLIPVIKGASAMFGVTIRESLTVVAKREIKKRVIEEVEDEDQSYTVARGDSYWEIAKKYYGEGDKYKIIQEYNGGKETIHPGDVLKIPSLKSYIGGEKLQTMLTALGHDTKGIDGKVGRNTTKALEAFQSSKGLNSSGQLDAQTRSALRNSFRNDAQLSGKALQIVLRDCGHSPGTVDGIVGKNTKRAIESFQSSKGLNSDGELNGDTLDALLSEFA